MAQGEVIAKLNYLCSNIRHIEIFLIFSEELLMICGVQMEKPTLRIGVREFVQTLNGCYQYWQNLKKKTYAEAKISYFAMEYFKGHLVAERLTDLYIWERPRGFYFFMS